MQKKASPQSYKKIYKIFAYIQFGFKKDVTKLYLMILNDLDLFDNVF